MALRRHSIGEDPRRAARSAVGGILVVANGFIIRSALYGEIDVDRFLEDIASALPRIAAQI